MAVALPAALPRSPLGWAWAPALAVSVALPWFSGPTAELVAQSRPQAPGACVLVRGRAQGAWSCFCPEFGPS